MSKRPERVVDIKIESLDFPDRASGHVLVPLAEDPVAELLEIPVDHGARAFREPERIVRMKGGIPGQVWRVHVKRRRQGAWESEPLELLQRSPLEKKALCSQASHCGGCNYQTLSYEAELMLKMQQLRRLYAEAGFPLDIGLHRSPRINGYRSKMEYTFGDNEPNGPLMLGLHRPRRFYDILPTPGCTIVPPDFNVLREAVQTFCRERGWAYYHRGKKEGFLRHLVLRASLTKGELMVNLVTSGGHDMTEKEKGEFVAMLHAQPTSFPVASVFHTINDGVADTVQADGLELLDGQEYIEEELFGLTFRVGPFSFFQPNVEGAKNLYAKALEMAGDLSGMTVYDLYTGTGTLAQIVARQAQRVIGVEIVEEAVEKARESAERNHIANCRFVAADVLAELAHLAEIGDAPDCVFLDPPRDGIHPKAIAHLLAAQPRQIVYISCNPRTQVRDLVLFAAGGYRIEAGEAFDQFSRTKHVECVCLMSRKG